MTARSTTTTYMLVCATLFASGGTAAAAPTTIATLHGTSAVRAWNGVQAWTDPGADQRLHVVVRSAGQISTPPAIPAGDERLEVDVGPGPGGKPMLAFVNCAPVCRVVVAALDGAGAQTVPGSAGASSPTIWGSRVAWVRANKTVLTRRLGGGKARRLAGVPRRICYLADRRRCERPGSASVSDLELHGSRLALIGRYGLPHGGGNGQTDVRMESVRGGRQHLVALLNVGESGQTWIGPAWAKGDLFFYKSCSGGCSRGAGGPYRYDPGSRTYARSRESALLSGFAMDEDGRRAFEAVDTGCAEDLPQPPCALQLSDGLAFTRTRPPIASEFRDLAAAQ